MSSFLAGLLKGEGGRMFADVGGKITVEAGGVRMFADTETEESYVEVKGAFDIDMFDHAIRMIGRLGYVLMDEMEDPDAIEEQSDGWVRHYLVLAKVEVAEREEMKEAS